MVVLFPLLRYFTPVFEKPKSHVDFQYKYDMTLDNLYTIVQKFLITCN